jgi:hypothetical protein
MQKWEYKVVRLDSTVAELGLNQMGDEGWELIMFWGGDYYFKRPKLSD